MAEVDVINLSDVSLVEVPSYEHLEKVFGWRQDLALLEDSSELFGRDMAGLGSVVVLELWLNQDSAVFNLKSNGVNQFL